MCSDLIERAELKPVVEESITEAITSSLPREKQGVASALNDLMRELGAALGVALLGGLLTAGYRTAISPHLDGIPDALAEPARAGVANAAAVSQDAGPHAELPMAAAQDAFVSGWR